MTWNLTWLTTKSKRNDVFIQIICKYEWSPSFYPNRAGWHEVNRDSNWSTQWLCHIDRPWKYQLTILSKEPNPKFLVALLGLSVISPVIRLGSGLHCCSQKSSFSQLHSWITTELSPGSNEDFYLGGADNRKLTN